MESNPYVTIQKRFVVGQNLSLSAIGVYAQLASGTKVYFSKGQRMLNLSKSICVDAELNELEANGVIRNEGIYAYDEVLTGVMYTCL